MTTQPPKRFRLIVDFKAQFPEKLYDVANDGYLIHWNSNGSVSVTSEEEFEQNVMKLYPGFLQIPTFLNFKRLFREYGFDRVYNEIGEPEFSHPMFVRGRRDLLCEIKTKRKSFRSPRRMWSEDVIPAEHGKRYSRRRRNKPRRFKAGNVSINSNDSSNDSSDIQLNRSSNNSTDIGSSYTNKAHESNITGSGRDHVSQTKIINVNNQQYVIDVINDYAENEFDEEEYTKWLSEQRKKDEMKALVEKKVVNRTQEFWWMYSDKNQQIEPVPSPTESTENSSSSETTQAGTSTAETSAPKVEETCMPCGFCKCCSAISNYVHIFGEVPENIQVFDFLQEAQAESS